MACTSLTNLPRACGTEGIVAGLENVYMIAYSDLAPTTGVAGDPVYTTASNGIVNAIGITTGKEFIEIGLLRSTAGLHEVMTKEISKGISFLTQTFTLVLSNLTIENKNWIENIMNQPVAILIKSRTGNFFFAGGNGQFELKSLDGGTGTAEGDLIGYTLTFDGIATKLIPQVDATIVAGLLVASTGTTTTTTV